MCSCYIATMIHTCTPFSNFIRVPNELFVIWAQTCEKSDAFRRSSKTSHFFAVVTGNWDIGKHSLGVAIILARGRFVASLGALSLRV